MTNFKPNQKVVFVHNENAPGEPLDENDPKDGTTVTLLNPGFLDDEFWEILENREWLYHYSHFRPISYSSNTNFEIIANFSPLEEKSDLPIILQPKEKVK